METNSSGMIDALLRSLAPTEFGFDVTTFSFSFSVSLDPKAFSKLSFFGVTGVTYDLREFNDLLDCAIFNSLA